MRITLLLVLMLTAGAPAQEQPGATFKSGVTMIQVPVVVRDRDGRVVGNLEKNDFQLFDNGKRVEIATFAVETPGARTAPDRSLPQGGAAGAPAAGAAATDIPERFTAYFFDDVSIGLVDLTRIREAVVRQLGALQPGDRAGIFTTSCHLMLDFTNDRAQLQETASRLAFAPPHMCRVSRAQVLQVEVLNNLIRRMSTLPARREIILVSPGFWVGHDRSFEAVDLIDAAIQAKVVIHTLDTGGATDRTGTGGGSRDPRMGGGLAPSGVSYAPDPTLPLVLLDLSHGTGGAYVTGNDFAVNFRQLATPESHYVLGFLPTGKADGRLHQLKVKLAKAGKLTVEARRQYVAARGQE